MLLLLIVSTLIAGGCRVRGYQQMPPRLKAKYERCDRLLSFGQRNEVLAAESPEEQERLLNRYCVAIGGRKDCCRYCEAGEVPCGDSCVKRGRACDEPEGCACRTP